MGFELFIDYKFNSMGDRTCIEYLWISGMLIKFEIKVVFNVGISYRNELWVGLGEVSFCLEDYGNNGFVIILIVVG